MLALFPFEPGGNAAVGRAGLHLLLAIRSANKRRALRPSPDEARRRLADPPLLLVLPGSRASEIRRMAGVFGDAVALTAKRAGALEVVVPAVPRLTHTVKAGGRLLAHCRRGW